MKKISQLILLSFIAFNLYSFSSENEQNTTKTDKQTLSNLDKAKVITAGLGCALFGWAALCSSSTIRKSMSGKDSDSKNVSFLTDIPPLIVSIPFIIANHLLTGQVRKAELVNGLKHGRILAILLACGSGAYVYKKLAQSKTDKAQKLLEMKLKVISI